MYSHNNNQDTITLVFAACSISLVFYSYFVNLTAALQEKTIHMELIQYHLPLLS